MSTDQITLDELNRPQLTVEQQRMAEYIEARAQAPQRNECLGCGHHVSVEFVRAFGRDNHVHACPHCATFAALKNNAASNPEFEPRADQQQAAGSWEDLAR